MICKVLFTEPYLVYGIDEEPPYGFLDGIFASASASLILSSHFLSCFSLISKNKPGPIPIKAILANNVEKTPEM